MRVRFSRLSVLQKNHGRGGHDQDALQNLNQIISQTGKHHLRHSVRPRRQRTSRFGIYCDKSQSATYTVSVAFSLSTLSFSRMPLATAIISGSTFRLLEIASAIGTATIRLARSAAMRPHSPRCTISMAPLPYRVASTRSKELGLQPG